MKTTLLSDGTPVPVIGQGTHRMGESAETHGAEIAILQGISLDMTLVDTAEDYANGGSEKTVGDAIVNHRDRVFVVTKVLPRHASFGEMPRACARSLERLQIDQIDLYLLHWWRNSVPHLDASHTLSLAEIVTGFEGLKAAGKICRWGVSNFSLTDMRELFGVPGGANCSANQVLYNLAHRKIETHLLPWCQEHKVLVMAYSPLGLPDNVLNNPVLTAVAKRHDASTPQIALAWIIRHEGVIAIPKSDRPSQTRENAQAVEIQLTQQDYAELEREFPR